MPYDKDGNLLWIADDTGAHEILQPGGGFNGRTREPGEPDWWVIAKDPAWQPDAMTQADPKAQAPFGGDYGGGGFGGAGATGDFGPGKLAGADSEAGQRSGPAEPWSVLSATQEHLDHIDKINSFGDAVSTIGSGIGEAVSKGAEGAGEALGKTWDELTGNKELHKGVEFGGKAAWEVSKDVAEMAGKDALGTYGGYWLKDTEKDPKITDAFGTAGSLINMGIRLYDKAPDWARGLGERINKIKDGVYSKE